MLTRSRRRWALQLRKHLRRARTDNLILQFRLFLAGQAPPRSAPAALDQRARVEFCPAGPAPVVADPGPSAHPDADRDADRGPVDVEPAGESSAEQLPASSPPWICNGCEQAEAKIAQLEAALAHANSRYAGLAEEIHESNSRRFRAEEALHKANLPKLKY